MSNRETHIEAITGALLGRRLEVERIGDTLNVKAGPGRFASKANIDLEPILTALADAQENQHTRMIGGFASGVKTAISEPPRSKANDWTYEQCAGRMMPNLEVDTYLLGVEAAGFDEPWHVRFSEDLLLVITIELDRGYRPLTQSQVDAWGATGDRVYSAARSMLFHKTRDVRLRHNDPREGVHTVKLGDGHDAARGIVLTEVFFSDLDESTFRFTAPSQDLLYYVQDLSDETLRALEEATEETYLSTDYPLSRHIFELQPTRPASAKAIDSTT